MDDFDYKEYEAVFNAGDDEALVERFFHDDCVFAGGSREEKGKAALLDFLHWAHDGIREVMRPQLVIRNGNQLFAEVDMDFHASKQRLDFPFKPMYPGDLLTVKFFVTYQLNEGKIVLLKAMTWAPERGVSKLPKLGAHPSQVAAFHAYVSAFGNADFERFPAFYTDDVSLELNAVPPIEGRQGIVDFYVPMFKQVREKLAINSVIATDDGIELDAVTRFTAIADVPDFIVGALKNGEYIEGRVIVNYQLVGGLINHIGVTRGGEMLKYDLEGNAMPAM